MKLKFKIWATLLKQTKKICKHNFKKFISKCLKISFSDKHLYIFQIPTLTIICSIGYYQPKSFNIGSFSHEIMLIKLKICVILVHSTMVEQPHPSKTAQMLLGKRNFMVIGRTKAGYFHSAPHSTLLIFYISNSGSIAYIV